VLGVGENLQLHLRGGAENETRNLIMTADTSVRASLDRTFRESLMFPCVDYEPDVF